MIRPLIGAGLFLFVCGCGTTGDADEVGASAGATGGFITGAGGAGVGSASHVSAAATTGTGSGTDATGAGGAGPEGKPPYPIVLAHGFFGFNDFAGAGFLSYFYKVKEHLEAEGEIVETPSVDPFNDSDRRGDQLIAHIEEILARTGAAKVNIIGHSQGGLDARAVAHKRPDLVASVVTIGTPHLGSRIGDVAVNLVSDPNAAYVVDELAKLLGGPLYDQVGNETSLTKPLHLFSKPGIAAFNSAHPDAPGVFYASIGGRSSLHAQGPECVGDVDVPFISAADSGLDPIDLSLGFSALVLSGGFKNYANDGLVGVKESRWGEFWGCIPSDHLDQVGQLFGDGPGLGNDWDYTQFYVDLIAYLRKRGF